MGRAAEEQRCTFYTADAAELCMSYETNHKIVKKKKRGTDEYVRNKYEFYSSKTYTWLQYNKRQIHVPGTTFSNFGDEVWMEGHENCCRFATLTGVHQRAHICLAKY